MEKNEVSVPFVQKQKEKISHTSLMNSRSKCNDQIVSVGGSPLHTLIFVSRVQDGDHNFSEEHIQEERKKQKNPALQNTRQNNN